MGPSMTRLIVLAAVVAGCLAAQFLAPWPTDAQTGGFQGWKPDRDTDPHTSVKVKVESGPNGVDMQMSVVRNIPRDRDRGRGDERDQPQDRPRGAPPAAVAPEQPGGTYTAPAGPA